MVEERKIFDEARRRRDAKAEIIGGQRRGFSKRWKAAVAALERRCGPGVADPKVLASTKVLPRLMEADTLGTDALWDQALKVTLEKRPGSPLPYLAAVLERMIEAAQSTAGETRAALDRILEAGEQEDMTAALASWLDRNGGSD